MGRNNNGRKILSITVISMVLWICGVCLYNMYNNIEIESNYETQKTISTNNVKTVESETENSKTIADMLEEVTKSVVGISKLSSTGSSIFLNTSEELLGLGTGVIVSEDGYILSNSHVTGEKYSTCYITLENGNVYTGTVMWANSDLDLSICKINAKNLKSIALGDSKKIRQGETVYAIGNPIGFEFRRTVTSGIISAVNRTIKLEEGENVSYMSDLIQTDATINPGNSGGPLISADGKVIGINTVKITSAEGIGFAVPINMVKSIIKSFEATGDFKEAIIGISAYDREVLPYIDSNLSFENGIYVVQISPNGAASKTELKVGDVINSIDNIQLTTMNDLREYIYTKSPGDKVMLNIKRGKISKQIQIILE